MNSDGKYQGWTNWDTWDANLWLTNDEDAYLEATDAETPDDLEKVFTAWFGRVGAATGYVDGIDPRRVNWQEIFDSLRED